MAMRRFVHRFCQPQPTPSRQRRGQRTLAWDTFGPSWSPSTCLRVLFSFVVEPFLIPSGSMEDTLLVGDRILVCKYIYGVGIPAPTSNFSTCLNPREEMCLYSFPFTRNPGTSSNASSPSKMTLTQNVCPAASAPATIFPPSAPPTFYPTTRLLPITSTRPNRIN